jgi:hypothetical protein
VSWPLVIHDVTEIERNCRWVVAVGTPDAVTHSVLVDRDAGRRLRKLLDDARAEVQAPAPRR